MAFYVSKLMDEVATDTDYGEGDADNTGAHVGENKSEKINNNLSMHPWRAQAVMIDGIYMVAISIFILSYFRGVFSHSIQKIQKTQDEINSTISLLHFSPIFICKNRES